MTIAKRLIESARPACAGLTFADVRLGLGYSCVELSNGGGYRLDPGQAAVRFLHPSPACRQHRPPTGRGDSILAGQ